jgi:hypothetical protein
MMAADDGLSEDADDRQTADRGFCSDNGLEKHITGRLYNGKAWLIPVNSSTAFPRLL